MKRLRAFSFILFICSITFFAYCKAKERQTDDRQAPVIQMDEKEITVSVKDGEEVLLQGITAVDNKDGDVTDSLTVDNLSDFTVDKKRYVTIAAFDSNNNISKVTRTLSYSDYTIPAFDFLEPLRFVTGNTDYLENVMVDDCIDGDLSAFVKFSDNTEIMADEAGDYKVQLQVRNSAGDTEYLPCTITVCDSNEYGSSPQVILKKYVQYVKIGKKLDYRANIDSVVIGGKEYDVVKGNQIGEDTVGIDCIEISDKSVDYKKAGVYEVLYSLTTKEDLKGTIRMVIVVED